jgi:hypothetical protein
MFTRVNPGYRIIAAAFFHHRQKLLFKGFTGDNTGVMFSFHAPDSIIVTPMGQLFSDILQYFKKFAPIYQISATYGIIVHIIALAGVWM